MIGNAGMLVLCLALVGCSHGTIQHRFFTSDAEHLIWEDGWGGYLLGTPLAVAGSSVKVTNCSTGETRTLASESICPIGVSKYLTFVPDAKGQYLLLSHADSPYKRDDPVRMTLVRLIDDRAWPLPLLPALDEEVRLVTGINLRVDPGSEPDLECSFMYVTFPQNIRTIAVHRLEDGAWTMGTRREPTDEELNAMRELRPGDLSSEAERITLSPDGRFVLYECFTPYKRFTELRIVGDDTMYKLTNQTDQITEWFERNVLAYMMD